jgi:hypothetical protein
MSLRRPSLLVAALLAAVLWASPVTAGGWATAELAPVPAAGVETVLGFRILQHGVTPTSAVTATFVATNVATGDQVQEPLAPGDTVGVFRASVTFPKAGEWSWYVDLVELGTDQEGAGGMLTVGPAMPAGSPDAAQLADLEQRLEAALARSAVLERQLAELEAETTATR